jgi:hypothetical protein
MKFRLTILVVFLSLILSACSLAEDITPPPGYSSPTFESTNLPSTQTSEPSSTSIPTSASVATSAESSPAATGSTTPAVDVSPTAQADVVVVEGTVTVASGPTLPNGTLATLLVYNTTSGQVEQTLKSRILPDGKFVFTNVPANSSTVFLVTVDNSGVTYNSSAAQFDGTLFRFDMPVTVYATTNDQNSLNITQTHLQFDFSTAGQVQIMALYVISNTGGNAVIVPSDGSSVPFIQVPEGATGLQFQLAQSSAPLMSATDGFALLPGADLQYGIVATFSMPYTKRLVFNQPFSLPVAAATVIVPEGVKVRSDQLTDAGTQAGTSSSYHLYQASNLASGSTLSMTVSGMPGDKPGFVLDQRTWLMIGVGAIGLILVVLGIFLFLRDRKLRKLEEEFEGDAEGEDDALGEDRESIMDAIITLEDQYKAGEFSKEAFEKRRDELKDRLKNLT